VIVLFDEFFLTEFLWEIILSEKCTIFDNLGRERECNFKIVKNPHQLDENKIPNMQNFVIWISLRELFK
jgi:hypothetical protein